MSDIDTEVVDSLKVLDPDGRLEKRTNTGMSGCPLCAISVLTRRSKKARYSITSSACASSVGGTSRPTAFAIIWSETVTSTRPVGLDHYGS